MAKTQTKPFDPADYLDNEDARAAYLNEAIESGDTVVISLAIGVVAKAKGMSAVAKATNLSRESLYRSLSADGNPEFATILKVLHAFGLRLETRPLWPVEPETESAV